MEKNKFWFSLMAVLSSVGIILASYLLYNFYNSKPALFCDINDKVNCQAVISGSLATFAGIPVALVGLVGYAVILFSSLTQRKKLALFMTSFGMIFCLRLTILEIFFIKVICPICLACQTIMLVLFIVSLSMNLNFKDKKNP
jgi:uncharacterized membrane protein